MQVKLFEGITLEPASFIWGFTPKLHAFKCGLEREAVLLLRRMCDYFPCQTRCRTIKCKNRLMNLTYQLLYFEGGNLQSKAGFFFFFTSCLLITQSWDMVLGTVSSNELWWQTTRVIGGTVADLLFLPRSHPFLGQCDFNLFMSLGNCLLGPTFSRMPTALCVNDVIWWIKIFFLIFWFVSLYILI